ncbi:MAG: SdrD B-like domain-containing protein, partial [Candidatus Bathyarchaeia archaeon]
MTKSYIQIQKGESTSIKNFKAKLTGFLLSLLIIIIPLVIVISSTSGQVGIDWNRINWVLIDEDNDESGGENWRDVTAAYAAYDANYLYLKLKTVEPPKFPTSKNDRDDDKYRWFLDFDGNMYWQGNVLYEAEYLISVQDKDDDGIGEMYLLFDSDNDSNFDDEVWTEIVVNSTDGGFRINGYQLEIYINWSKIGGMPHVLWLSWCTDRSDNNLNQCPTTDRAETAYGVVIRLGSISGYKWEDLNRNGFLDMGDELPIQGWEIHLQSGAMSWEAYTDESGYYQFIALPEGTYIVSETIPYGWIQTYPGNNSYIVQIRSGEQITGKDFGNFETMASLSIRKTAGATQAHVGDEIEYSFNITNTGNVPLLIENVTDNVIGSIMINQLLEPNQWIIVNAKYTVKESDPDPLANTATVYATYNSSTLSASDTWIIDILHPSIMVEKTANATEAYIGDTIQYKINVTNTGDCNLYNVNVSDSLFGNLLTNGILRPKQSIIFTKTYIAKNEGKLTNTANASGTDPLGMCVYNEDSWTVNVLIPPQATASVTFNATGLSLDASDKTVLTVDGTSYTYSQLPLTFEWIVGSSHNFSWKSPVDVNSGKRYIWTSTNGLSELQNGEIIVPTGGGNITGNYITQYHLMVETDPDGLTPQPTREPAGEQDPAGGWWYNASISVTLTAQQVEGFKFSYWSINGSNQGDGVNPITVVIDASKTAIAHYAKLPTVANVTFSVKDVQEDYTGIILIVDEEEYDLDKLPITFTWDIGSNHTFEFKSPLIVNLNQKRYVWISTSGLSVLRNGTITVPNEGEIVEATYKTQYYLNVQSSYGVTDGEGWYDEGATAYARLNTGLIDHGNGTRRAFTHWSGDASGANYAQSNPIIMNASKTAIAVWKTQHYLTVISPYDAPGGMGWYDEGATAYATLAYGIQEIAVGKRARFTSWSGDASGTSLTSNPITMDKPKTAIALWTIQWYLTVKVDPFGIGTIQGEGWYDDSTSVTLQAPQYLPSINGVDGIRYRFSHWDVDGAQVGGNPITVHMNAAHTATAHYIRQYEVAFSQTGVSSEYTGCIIEIDSVGYGLADLPKSFWWDEGSTHEFTFQSPLNVNAAKRFVWVSTTGLSPHQSANITITELGEIIGNYKTQWLQIFDSSDNVKTDGIGLVITVNEAQVLTNALPYELWADTGTTINYRFEDEVSSSLAGKRYKLKSISGPLSGYVISSSNLVRGNYGVQYYLDVNSPYGAPTPKSGWHDAGTLITAFVTSPWPTNPINTRYICIGWTGTGSVPSSGTKASVTFAINEPSSITWNWKTQYLVNFTQTGSLIPPAVTYQIDSGPTATKPAPFGLWIDVGSQISYNYPEAISEAAGTRYLLTSISPTSPQIINAPLTVIGTYITQYYLDVVSPYGSPSGMGWYDEGAIAHAALAYGIEEIPLNVRFVFTGWSGDASGTNLISNPILMDAPKTAIANWKTQFYLTLNTSPEGVTAPFGEGWYDADTYANISTPQFVEVADGSRYRFNCWTTSDIDEITDPNTPTTSVLMDKAKTVTANYIIQYYLEIEVEPPDSAIVPGEGWYDEGAIVVVIAPEYWPSTEGKRFHFDRWTIDGTLNLNNQLVVLMDKPHSATAHYIIQYSVTFIQKGLDQYAVGKVLEVN